ncbi:hypothetical protein SAMN06272789_0961 [Streptomyces sp. 1331.2]|nr:hypothetical protein SAMN06272789_0961 [Streptomyces sp. 1331.2]
MHQRCRMPANASTAITAAILATHEAGRAFA